MPASEINGAIPIDYTFAGRARDITLTLRTRG